MVTSFLLSVTSTASHGLQKELPIAQNVYQGLTFLLTLLEGYVTSSHISNKSMTKHPIKSIQKHHHIWS